MLILLLHIISKGKQEREKYRLFAIRYFPPDSFYGAKVRHVP